MMHIVFILFSGPYIVYMLKDMDIIEDWTAIKKVWLWKISIILWLWSVSVWLFEYNNL